MAESALSDDTTVTPLVVTVMENTSEKALEPSGLPAREDEGTPGR